MSNGCLWDCLSLKQGLSKYTKKKCMAATQNSTNFNHFYCSDSYQLITYHTFQKPWMCFSIFQGHCTFWEQSQVLFNMMRWKPSNVPGTQWVLPAFAWEHMSYCLWLWWRNPGRSGRRGLCLSVLKSHVQKESNGETGLCSECVNGDTGVKRG